MKRHLLPLFLLLFATAAFSQSAADALKYSYLVPGGTARYLGAGGAFGALGAEFSTLSQNPAGLAMYRTDELMFTPSIRFANTDATVAGNGNPTLSESKSHFHFDNIGIVFNTNPGEGKWTTFNVGLGYNQLANYNQGIYYTGNGAGTILNKWFDAAAIDAPSGNVDDLEPFTSRLASDVNAMYFQDNAWTYDFAGNTDAVIEHTQSITQSGTMNEMVLSFAGNYDEKLLIGATVGVPIVKYRLNGEYRELDPADNVDYFDELTYTESLQTNGVGINFKFGVIYKASQAIRLGASFHSPTWLSLTDNFSNTFDYTYTDGGGSNSAQAVSPEGTSDYKLVTPWRASISGAVVFKKYGFLSAEVETVDYSANRYNFTSDIANTANQLAETRENNAIQRQFRQTINVRIGGEAALDNFRLRAGVNLLGKPYSDYRDPDDPATNVDNTGFNMAYTAGIGVRSESFFIDLGYRFRTGESTVSPYKKAPVVETKNNISDILLTLGFKF